MTEKSSGRCLSFTFRSRVRTWHGPRGACTMPRPNRPSFAARSASMRSALLLSIAALTGCATSLGAAHDARVLDRGHVEVHLGTGVLVPLGGTSQAIKDGVAVLEDIASKVHDGSGFEIH